MATVEKASIAFRELFNQHLSGIHLPKAVRRIKEEAIQQAEQQGLPGMKHEEWKYTYLQKYLKKGFHFGRNTSSSACKVELPHISPNTVRIVLYDGQYQASFSGKNPEGIYISGLKQALTEENILATELFGSLAHNSAQSMTALHLALSEDGFFLHAAPGAKCDIELIFIHSGSSNISLPHALIQLEEGAEVHINERHIQLGQQSFQHYITEVKLEKTSRLDWVKVQDAGAGSHLIDTTYTLVNESARFRSTTISLTGDWLRNNQYIQINGRDADADLNGLYVLDAEQQADNIIVIKHQLPEGTSNQLFKGILDGKSTGVFNGKIVVDQDAQKTNAFQSNKNILVSDESAAFFRPQLEIFADDVKCSHGATSSEIEDSELFYLRARGISKDTARSLLMLAFAADVLESIQKEEVKAQVLKSIEHKLNLSF
jgi:Fe-S cluster assembly protein SufD